MIPIYNSAFQSDPLSLYCFPRRRIPPSEFTRWLTERFTMLYHRPETHYFGISDENGVMVAMARWSFPYVKSAEEKKAREEEKKVKEERDNKEGRDTTWPIGADKECCDEKFGGIGRAFEELVLEGEREDIYGEFLAKLIVYLLFTDSNNNYSTQSSRCLS
jgi:hypothetical protein